GQAVIDRYRRERGTRLRVDLSEPEVVVRVELRGRELMVGIDTTGRSLHRRGYRAYLHPAPLKPTAAHALLRIAGWRHEEALIDPFCGSGTVCIEAVRWAWRMPNLLRRRSLRLWRLGFLPLEELERLADEAEAGMRRVELEVRGCDISPKHLQGAKQNASLAGVEGGLEFFQCDATELSYSQDVVVANLPYGLRMGSPRKVAKVYERFERALSSGSWRIAVLLTARPELYPAEPDSSLDVTLGTLPARVLVFRK
ncbi:MAG: methyltransferase domain-containing protein, partial [Euryarchaeota archaeon]|nr:methyltransferase domain-containing protein [Euryarchaeota archaeon]